MLFEASRRTTKRAAAALAEERIKVIVEQVNAGSSGEESRASERLSDYGEEAPVNLKKKPSIKEDLKDASRTAAIELSKEEEGAPYESAQSATGTTSNAIKREDSESSLTEPSSEHFSGSCIFDFHPFSQQALAHVDTDSSRERRAGARRQHSGGPMRLSRRHSYRLSDPSLSPYMFSPIEAARLLFSPPHQTEPAVKKPTKAKKANRGDN